MNAVKLLLVIALLFWSTGFGGTSVGLGIRFVTHDGKPIDVEAIIVTPFGEEIRTVASGGSIFLSHIVRGSYAVLAYWKGVQVGTAVFGITAGNLAGEVMVAVRDLAVTLSDFSGTTALVDDVNVDLKGPSEESSLKGVRVRHGALFVPALPEGVYTIFLRWLSPYSEEQRTIGEFSSTLEGFNNARQLRSQIFNVKFKILDLDGQPVVGGKVILGQVAATTDAMGEAVFRVVPKGTYQLTVLLEGKVLSAEMVEVSQSSRDFVNTIGLYKLRIKTSGLLDQSLPHSTIILRKNEVIVRGFTANEDGFLEVSKLTEADYRLEAVYKGYTVSKGISREQLTSGEIMDVRLPIFLEVLGIPFSFERFLLLFTAHIGLLLSTVILLHEYALWRRRRVGVKTE